MSFLKNYQKVYKHYIDALFTKFKRKRYLKLHTRTNFFFNLLFIIMTHSHLQVTSSVVFYSRIAEIRYEIEYGERKQYSAYSERTAILDMRSGTTTPRQPAFSASQSFA